MRRRLHTLCGATPSNNAYARVQALSNKYMHVAKHVNTHGKSRYTCRCHPHPKATFTVHEISVNVNMCFQRANQMISKSRYQIAHAKSGIRKLGHDLLVSGDSTDSSGARGCPVIARGTICYT